MKETLKYKFLIFVRYFGDALYYPFLSLYLVSTGLTESRIGFLLSITPLIGIILNPFYTMLCKNVKITRNVLRIITVCEALLIVAISFATNFYVIAALILLIAIFGSSHYGLMDSMIAIYANESKTSYSNYRMFGSLAYIIATACGGYIISASSYRICFIIGAVLFVASGIIYSFIKPIEIGDVEEEKKEKVKLNVLLKNKDFVFFLIFHVIFMGAMNSLENFFAVYLESRGVIASQYGFVYSYFVIFEVIVAIILNRFFKKANFQVLHLIAASLMLARYVINFFNLPVGVIIGVAGFRGISFALILYITYQYIVKLVGEKNSITAVMFLTLVTSIITVVLNNVFGTLIENHGYQTFYFIGIVLFVLIVGLAIFRLIYYKKRNQIKTIQ